ncbi:hypothetical protein AWN76_015255 [Rhodothermaceae bacterium RA]|nr:hypothetical protein AWN76_015255 [Rhodothermaceae bacterium RA]
MRCLLLPMVLLLGACAAPPPAPAPMIVMTYNIRYDNPGDGPHAWPHRRDQVASLIRFHGADLIGVQEALRGQMDDLAARLPDHAWLGVGRDDGRDAGEFSAIFYRADRFEVLDHGTFWLSETPEVVASKSWDAAITRIVTWARFRDAATGAVFYHVNTHFDHRGAQARLESARLLTAWIAETAGDLPVLVTGDFNLTPDDPPYPVLTQTLTDAYHASVLPHHGPDGTFSGFEVRPVDDGRRIDYIFTRGPVRVLRHGTLSDHYPSGFPSDHLPVLAEVVLGG